MNILTKLEILLLVTLYIGDTTQSLYLENKEITIDEENDVFAAHIPVIPASLVYDRLEHKLNSPNEEEQEEARGILESLLSQIQGTTEQYARITMHGLRYAVNVGKKDTALRAHNEQTGLKLWELLREILAKILALFGIKLQKNVDEKDQYNKDTLYFDIATTNQLIKRFEFMVQQKRDLLQRVRQSTNSQVTDRVYAQIEKMINDEEGYKNDLKIHVEEQQERLKNIDNLHVKKF